MTSDWPELDCDRPDPYLDWEFRTRCVPQIGEPRKPPWCSVHVRVLADSSGDYLPALCELLRAVEQGRLDSDDIELDPPTIRMTDDERRQLCALIKDMKAHPNKPHDKVEMQFFIYRLEFLIYDQGQYARTDIYETIQAGPPIEGLAFNDAGAFSPLTFEVPPTIEDIVAVGIIDDGIAFAHERFRDSHGGTRLYAIWIQELERQRQADGGVLFGQRVTKDEIDCLLATCKSEDRIYRSVGVTDFGCRRYNPLASRSAHGTHVLDLASGYGPSRGGDPPPILAVQLPSVATIDTSGVTMGSYVLQAARMIMSWANVLKNGKPVQLVINFSYGLLAGPKDGTQYIENALAEMVAFRNDKIKPTSLVLPAGNSYRTRAAARIKLTGKKTESLDWIVLPDDETPNFVEIWLEGAVENENERCAPVEIALVPPDEQPGPLYQLEQGKMRAWEVDDGPIAGIYYLVSPKTSRPCIFLAIGPSSRNEKGWPLAPSGRWRIAIHNRTEQELTAHFYVQRDDTPFGYRRRGRQSYFDHKRAYLRDKRTCDYVKQADDCPIIYEETLSAIATAPKTLVVGGAEAADGHPPSDYTSSGPTNSKAAPDWSAFSDDGDAHLGRMAAGTFSGSVVRMRGTSVAAPQIVRMMMDGSSNGRLIPVTGSDCSRLGPNIFEPPPDGTIPRRRYPAT